MGIFKKKEMNYADFVKKLEEGMFYDKNTPEWEKLERYKIQKINSNYDKKLKKEYAYSIITAVLFLYAEIVGNMAIIPWFNDSVMSEEPDTLIRIARIVVSAIFTLILNGGAVLVGIFTGIGLERKTSDLKKDRNEETNRIWDALIRRREEEDKQKRKQKNS